MPLLSVTVITFNEERNIRRCLNSVKEIADEIIIVDSGSTDNTISIAKEFNAVVVDHPFKGFVEQKNLKCWKKQKYCPGTSSKKRNGKPEKLSKQTVYSDFCADLNCFDL